MESLGTDARKVSSEDVDGAPGYDGLGKKFGTIDDLAAIGASRRLRCSRGRRCEGVSVASVPVTHEIAVTREIPRGSHYNTQ